MLRIVALFVLALFAAGAVHAQALTGRLKKIAETKSIAIAYRPDATPFSFVHENNPPEGYSIDLCKRVVDSIGRQLKVEGIQVKWVPVTVQSRFDAVAKGGADMECGSSTMTLGRLQQVDFSSIIFVESTGLMVKSASGVRAFPDLSGRKIAVVGGTTNERAVNTLIKARQLSTTVVAFGSRDEALAALEEGKADAFASDTLLLIGAASKAKDRGALTLLKDQLSFEPYGIVLPRGDAAFRLAVNTGLSQVFTGDDIVGIFRRWFGALGTPSPVLEAAYILGSIPE